MAMGVPLTKRLSIVVLPVPAAPATCDACATTESAVMPTPATFIFKFASETAESTSSGQLIVPALRTSPVSTEGTVPVSMDASRASLTPLSVPVSAREVVVVRRPKAPKRVARTAAASPVIAVVVVVVELPIGGKRPPSWPRAAEGKASRPAISRGDKPKSRRPGFALPHNKSHLYFFLLWVRRG